MSRKLGLIQQRILAAPGGYSLRGAQVAERLAPISPSAVRRALVLLGRLGVIVQDRETLRWSLPLPPSTPGIEAATRKLVRGMRKAAENVEITKLKKTIRELRMENRRLQGLLRESEINPYPPLEKTSMPRLAEIKRGF